jgi:hypothetical protein
MTREIREIIYEKDDHGFDLFDGWWCCPCTIQPTEHFQLARYKKYSRSVSATTYSSTHNSSTSVQPMPKFKRVFSYPE